VAIKKTHNNINVTIKNVVSDKLYQKRNQILKESLSIKSDIDFDNLVMEHTKKTIRLINEGYTLKEIENQLNEQMMDKIKDIPGSVKNMLGDDFDYGSYISSSLMSMGKEFIIKWILDFIGFGPSMSKFVAQAAADLSFKDLILPFKNKEYCIKHLPNVLDAMLEMLVRYAGASAYGQLKGVKMGDKYELYKEKAQDELIKKAKENNEKFYKGDTDAKFTPKDQMPKKYTPDLSKNSYEWGDLPGIFLGNLAGDFIRKTGSSEFMANHICPIFHKD
jgi:hypothetical protein